MAARISAAGDLGRHRWCHPTGSGRRRWCRPTGSDGAAGAARRGRTAPLVPPNGVGRRRWCRPTGSALQRGQPQPSNGVPTGSAPGSQRGQPLFFVFQGGTAGAALGVGCRPRGSALVFLFLGLPEAAPQRTWTSPPAAWTPEGPARRHPEGKEKSRACHPGLSFLPLLRRNHSVIIPAVRPKKLQRGDTSDGEHCAKHRRDHSRHR